MRNFLRQIRGLQPDDQLSLISDHLCLIYETEAEHRAVLTSFLRQGLESGDKVIYIIDARTGETLLGYLRDDGVDADAYVQSGQLEILEVQATFMRQGVFNPEGMIQVLRAETDKALAEGYRALRISCEMSWALRGLPGSEHLIEYEAKLNDFLAGNQCLAFCQYDRRRFAPDLLLKVMATHPLTVIGNEFYDNSYYIPPEDMLGPDPYSARLTNLVRNLQERKRNAQYLNHERLRTDEASRQARETLRVTIDAVPVAIIDLDMEGKVKSLWNPAAEKMLGWRREEVLGDFLPFVPENARGKFVDFCKWVQVVKLIMESEVALRHKDGSLMEYSIYVAPQYGDCGKVIGNIIMVLVNITEWKLVEQKLLRATRALKTHSLCNEALVRAQEESTLLQDICRIIVEEGEYSQAWVGFHQDNDPRSLRPVAWAGIEAGLLDPVRHSWGRDQTMQDPGEIAITTGNSAICLPLEMDSQVIGSLTIEAQKPSAFHAEEIKLLEELARDLSFGIKSLRTCLARRQAEDKLRESLGKVRETIIEVVQAMALTLEIRDPYTSGHQRRVTQLAVAIAEEMDLDKDRIEGLRVAGFMHDIGKIAVPAEILSKPSKLSEYEFGIVKSHARVGYEILSRVSFPWPVAQIVLQHHENLDGSGYPQGLKGDDILPETRMLTVADVVEAMASHRPYRPALGIEKALEEITRYKGQRYDPEVVNTCVKLFTQKGFNFE